MIKYLSTPCAAEVCGHPYNWHQAGACTVPGCRCIAFAVPAPRRSAAAIRAAEYRQFADDLDADAALLTPTDQRAKTALAGAARILRTRATQLDPSPETPR